jgi:hypothetical protein
MNMERVFFTIMKAREQYFAMSAPSMVRFPSPTHTVLSKKSYLYVGSVRQKAHFCLVVMASISYQSLKVCMACNAACKFSDGRDDKA